MARYIDEVGHTYGRLTVVAYHKSRAKVGAIWLCRCTCGRQHLAIGTHLRRGTVRSCGCLGIDARRRRASAGPRDLRGKRYGRLTVVALESTQPARWRCSCRCGGEKVALGYNLTRLLTTSCGCARFGRKSFARCALCRVTRHRASGCPLREGYQVRANRLRRRGLSVVRVANRLEISEGTVRRLLGANRG